MYKTFDNVLQIDRNDYTYEDYYRKIINSLGVEKVRKCIPFDLEELLEAHKENKNFNNLPMQKWDFAAGFISHRKNSADVLHIGSPLTHLYNAIGVTCYSSSDGVCILKQAAKDMVLEHILSQDGTNKETT